MTGPQSQRMPQSLLNCAGQLSTGGRASATPAIALQPILSSEPVSPAPVERVPAGATTAAESQAAPPALLHPECTPAAGSCPLGLRGCVDCFNSQLQNPSGCEPQQQRYNPCSIAGPMTRAQAMASALQEEAYHQGSADNLAVLAVDLQVLLQQQGACDHPAPSPEASAAAAGLPLPRLISHQPRHATDASAGASVGIAAHGVSVTSVS